MNIFDTILFLIPASEGSRGERACWKRTWASANNDTPPIYLHLSAVCDVRYKTPSSFAGSRTAHQTRPITTSQFISSADDKPEHTHARTHEWKSLKTCSEGQCELLFGGHSAACSSCRSPSSNSHDKSGTNIHILKTFLLKINPFLHRIYSKTFFLVSLSINLSQEMFKMEDQKCDIWAKKIFFFF